MSLYLYRSSEAKLEQCGPFPIHSSSAEELISLLQLAPEGDIFIWEYDYPWSDIGSEDAITKEALEKWNEKQQYILSLINKDKSKFIFFNRSVITLSSVIKHISSEGENREIKDLLSDKQKVMISQYLGFFWMWGNEYWRTLERLDEVSLRPNGIKLIRENDFTNGSEDKLICAANFLSDVINEVAALEDNIKLRFNEISTLTLMLQESQSKEEKIFSRNNSVKIKNDQLNIKETMRFCHVEDFVNFSENPDLKEMAEIDYLKEISKLNVELSQSKASLACRFNELAHITRLLEKANREVLKLQGKISAVTVRHEKIKNSFSWKATAPIRALSYPVKIKKEKINNKLNKKIQLIRNSVYFDSEWYLLQNPDVECAGIEPAKHYLLFGGFENRDPSSSFSNEVYFDLNPDVKEKGINPLEHYIVFGIKENRKVNY